MAGVIAGIGLALSAVGSGVGFAQAAKARREQRKAQNEQRKLMQKAKERAEKNFYDTLNVPVDAFENQFKQNQQVAAQALQALQQGDARNLAAGIGGLQAAASQANEVVRTGMQDALYENQKMNVEARDRVNQQLIDMEVGAAADQAQIARDFGADAAAGIQGGIASAQQAAQQASALVPLFGKSKADRAGMKIEEGFGVDALGKSIAEGGTGMTAKQRADKLRSYEFTPKDVRQFQQGGTIDVDKFKTFVTGDDPRFKNLQAGIGDVTDLASLQKLLYGYE